MYLYVYIPLICRATPCKRYAYYPHFTDEKTEEQTFRLTGHRLSSHKVVELKVPVLRKDTRRQFNGVIN